MTGVSLANSAAPAPRRDRRPWYHRGMQPSSRDRRALDVAAVIALALAGFVLRAPALHAVALNPDESQYEATASYLLATGRSAFGLPSGVPGTLALYKLVGLLAGPYAVWPMRVLVAGLALLVAGLIFLALRRAGGLAGALLGGAVFLYQNLLFEGHSANREWFAIALILPAALLARRGAALEHGGGRRLFAAGVLAGLAIWFKLQAGVLALGVPLFLLWDGTVRRTEPRRILRDVGAYAAGGMLAVGVYLLLLASRGGLVGYWRFLTTFSEKYVGGNAAETSIDLLERLLLGLPGWRLVLAAYLVAALVVVADLLRAAGRDGLVGRGLGLSLQRLFVSLLVAALVAVQLGQHFFEHYFLLLLPASAALFGLGVDYCLRAGVVAPLGRVAGGLGAALLVGDLIVRVGAWNAGRGPHGGPALLLLALFVVASLAVMAWAVVAPSRRLLRAVGALLALEALGLIAAVQLGPPPRSLPFHAVGFDDLVRTIDARRAPDDRLFVWGWAPEIYSLTRMEAASSFSITQYVVGDYRAQHAEPRLDPYYAAALLDDLAARPPRFIVDASRRSWTMAADGQPTLYRLEQYPDFGLVRLLHERYTSLGRYDDCELYALAPGASATLTLPAGGPKMAGRD